MGMKLFELSKKWEGVLDLMEDAPEEKVFSDEDRVLFEELEGELDEKIERTGMVIRSLGADVSAIKEERKRLAAREKSLSNRADWLKAYLLHEMTRAKKQKVKGKTLSVSLRMSPPSCVIVDEDKVPDDFKEYRTEVHVDKKAITDHFKVSGEVVDGVEIICDKQTVQVR